MKMISLMIDGTTVAGLIAAMIVFFCGCTHSGQIVRFEQRSNVGISSMDIGEYTIPIVSISTGPSLTVYQREGQACVAKISGFASTTNTTSALGIYSSSENKSMEFKGVVITNCETNSVGVKVP